MYYYLFFHIRQNGPWKFVYYFLYLQRAYLRLSFSNMPQSSEIFKCREFESFQTVFFGFFHLWFLTSFFRRLGIKKARSYGLFGTFIYFVSAIWYAWMESNHRTRRRRPMLYPLSYRRIKYLTLKLYQIILKFSSSCDIILKKIFSFINFNEINCIFY